MKNTSENPTIQTYSQIHKEYKRRSKLNNDILSYLNKFVSLLDGKKVLDIGCAYGRDSAYLIGKGLNVIGVDLTPEFIELARKAHPKGEFQVMDMRNLQFEQNTFDGIWACASFLHIPKKEALMTLCGFHRVLKSNGLLFVSVMSGDGEGYRKHEKLGWGDRYFSFYSKTEFQSLLESASFDLIEIIETQTSWGPVFLNCFFRSKI